jgi:CubicO group peptidase (beta-lactamase class C family)
MISLTVATRFSYYTSAHDGDFISWETLRRLDSRRLPRIRKYEIMMQTKLKLPGAMILLSLLFAAITPAGGFSSSVPDNAALPFDEALNTLPRLRSLLISIDGELVDERYFNGARFTDWANLKSASKSIMSTLVGIALDRGQLKSIRDPIAKFFPEHLGANADALKKRITIEDLLTMRSGLETTSSVNYGQWVTSGHWVRYVLTRPVIDEPGGRMIYSTGNSHLLSAILTKATKMGMFEFARRYLAEPLGIPIRPWIRDPQGIYLGGNDMHLTPRAMLKYGELYLNRGRVQEKQVVSTHWIEESLKPRTQSSWSGRDYGYGWWIDSLAGHRTHYAWGHGGQFIFIVPGLKLVVVTTALPTPDDGRREHQRAIYDLMERHLIPTAERKQLAAVNSKTH